MADAGGQRLQLDADRLDGLVMEMEEARRLLELQERDLEALKGRAGVLLGSASVVTGLVAALTDQAGGFDRAMVSVAVAAYVGTVAMSLDVLRPHPWVFSHGMSALVEANRAGRYLPRRDVAWHLMRVFLAARQRNAKRLARLQNEYFLGCGLLALQVVAWAAAAL